MTKQSNEYFHQEDLKYYLQTFKRFPITFSHGKGAKLWDVDGKEYVDALAGIAVNNIGHAHPHFVQALTEQASKVAHVSNFFLTKPQVDLSRKLTELSGLDRVFLTNSGAESVEGAIKIARKYAHSKKRGGKIISFEGSFHGRTMATIATGKKKMQQGFEPIPQGFQQIPFNEIEAVKSVIDNETAAFIIEPIQGEGGINIAEKDFLKELREICDQEDIVLIFDEVQCGMGRTGKWFAKDHIDVEPDIMSLAKALGSGFPIGAVLSNEKISSAIEFGDHGTTFGGNPLACAAALAGIEIMENENLLEAAIDKGKWLINEFNNLGLDSIKDIRGKGLMIGVEFDFETPELVKEMIHNGVIANTTAGNVLRLVPPLVITKDELKEVLESVVNSVEKIKDHA